jgi:hypothetical protein
MNPDDRKLDITRKIECQMAGAKTTGGKEERVPSGKATRSLISHKKDLKLKEGNLHSRPTRKPENEAKFNLGPPQGESSRFRSREQTACYCLPDSD